MITLGARKQEEKLKELAMIAKRAFPDADEMAIKGALRQGAREALKESHFSSWAGVASQPAAVRRDFFDRLLERARPKLKILLGEEGLDALLGRMRAANEKYLRD